MDCKQFLKMVHSEGFKEVVRVTREPGAMLASHTHPFEAKALILDGEIRIATATDDRTYCAGDIFHLRAHEPHAEFYGRNGVQYLVGRK